MKYFFLFFLLTHISSLQAMIHPFEGKPSNAKKYIKERKKIEPWMVSQSIMLGYIGVLKVLLEEGKYPINTIETDQKRSKIYYAPLHYAVIDEKSEIVKYLLKKKADINIKSVSPIAEFNNLTPLHLACAGNKPKIMKLLLKKGADIKVKDGNNKTPLDLIPVNNKEEILKVIKNTKSLNQKKKDLNEIFTFY